MKSTAKRKIIEQKIKYPCLMSWTGGDMIVLFTSQHTGTVVNVDNDITSTSRMLGETDDQFSMHLFEPFHGTVTLENGE